jgi:hypothetical protein
MYWGGGGGAAMNQRCPHCGTYGEHRVERTFPADYHWDGATVPIWEEILGHDLSYRMRERVCRYCDLRFNTVEISNDDFRSVIIELLGLRSELAESDARTKEKNANIAGALKQLRAATKLLRQDK